MKSWAVLVDVSITQIKGYAYLGECRELTAVCPMAHTRLIFTVVHLYFFFR